MTTMLERRALLRAGALGLGGLALARMTPGWAQSGSVGLPNAAPLTGTDIRLTVGHSPFTVGGRTGHAVTVNGVLPAPLIRLREGVRTRLIVENRLDEDTSVHWHGLLVPFQMDGVPGVSFPGIAPGGSFTYEFPLIQSGTYWYHSHSGMQEQMGHYGPLIIDPAGEDPIRADREHVVMLSDWSFRHPHAIYNRLKQEAGYFNRQQLALLKRSATDRSLSAADRAMFARMRMDPTDIADITGATYHYLVNGHGPQENWTGLFQPGERVRLRIIAAGAQTIFNFRIPGLAMTIVAADGVPVQPVEVDEFQIGNAETYDVIVTPVEDRAYSIVAESVDRSGMAVATLAPRMGMRAPVPPLRERPILTMADMGMGHGGMDHGSMGDAAAGQGGMDHAAMNHSAMDHTAMNAASTGSAMDHAAMGHAAPAADPAPVAAHGAAAAHGGMNMRDASLVPFPVGVGVDMIAPAPADRTGFPGIGLDTVDHRVLTYRQLAALHPRADAPAPTRHMQVHLTGNMERFMWSMDGQRLSERPEPYRFALGERVRMTMVNHTMMTHPMHLHGHFFEVVNGQGARQPLKHTVMVFPGGTVTIDFTADAPGDWAFHCHMLYHMHAGMMRVVSIRPLSAAVAGGGA